MKDCEDLLQKLTQRARDISRKRYSSPEEIFEMTKTDKYPDSISDLAESFGMMIVKVEARELRYERTIKKLKKMNGELQHEVKERQIAEKTVQVFMDIVDNIDLGLCVYFMSKPADDKTLQLIAANEAAREMSKKYLPESDESKHSLIFPGVDRRVIIDAYRETSRTKGSFKLGDIRFQKAGQTAEWFYAKAFYLPNKSMGFFFEDISERKCDEFERDRLIRKMHSEIEELKRSR